MPSETTFASDARALLAKVHIARKELAMDEAGYRAALLRATGRDSARGCTRGQLIAALAEFKRLGWKPAERKISQKAQVRMIHAIWRDLHPYLASGTDDALRAFVRRQTKSPTHPDGVGAPEWLDAEQANLVIEGLKGWLARARRQAAAGRPPEDAA